MMQLFTPRHFVIHSDMFVPLYLLPVSVPVFCAVFFAVLSLSVQLLILYTVTISHALNTGKNPVRISERYLVL